MTTNYKEYKTNLLTLSFPGDIEREYQDAFFKKSLRHNRKALLLAIFFFSIFGFLDAWTVPTVKEKLWIIRYALFLPFTLGVFLFSFSRYFKRYAQASIAAVILLAGLGVNAMIIVAPQQEIDAYYTGLILILFYGYAFIKIGFVWVTLMGWIIVVSNEIVAIWVTQTPIPILINNNFFFITGNLFGMFVAYSIELYSRKDFAQTKLLEEEKKRVKVTNKDLTKRVAEGTKQINKTNDELRQEIEERKAAEVGLRESERRYKTLYDDSKRAEEVYRSVLYTSADAIVIYDMQGKALYINHAFTEIFGWIMEEVENQTIPFLPESERKATMAGIKEIVEHGRPVAGFETKRLTKDGRMIDVMISGSRFNDHNGNPSGMLVILRDISEKVEVENEMLKAKEEAEKANRAKSEFLANMSHELRTPLNHIIGFTELILDNDFGELSEIQEEFLTDIDGSSKLLLSLINDILDLSKVEAGKLELELTEIDLRTLLENSLRMIKEKCLKHGIHLSIDMEGIPDRMLADERKLKQIIYNLLSNAVKFTPEKGSIGLSANPVDWKYPGISDPLRNREDGFIQICVADDGIGINEVLPIVKTKFEVF